MRVLLSAICVMLWFAYAFYVFTGRPRGGIVAALATSYYVCGMYYAFEREWLSAAIFVVLAMANAWIWFRIPEPARKEKS